MGVAYAEVVVEILGRRYRTVHGVQSTATALMTTFGPPDLAEWGGGTVGDPTFDDYTDPAGGGGQPSTLFEALIFMHRYMQRPEVIIRQLVINDGPTIGVATGNFKTYNLDLQCRGNTVANGGYLQSSGIANLGCMF